MCSVANLILASAVQSQSANEKVKRVEFISFISNPLHETAFTVEQTVHKLTYNYFIKLDFDCSFLKLIEG